MRKESHEVRTTRHLPYSRSFKRQHYRLSPIGDYNLSLFSRNSYSRLFYGPNCCPSGIYELPPNCAEADLPKNLPFKNYAAQFLMPDDETINPASKKRYYRILTEIDQSFSGFQHPDTSKSFYQCCESAVRYLREKTRANSLILEENINYGFYRTLYSNKATGIILCIVFGGLTAAYSLFSSESLSQIPISNYIALSSNIALLLFWIFGVTENGLESTGKQYAKALLSTIDLL